MSAPGGSGTAEPGPNAVPEPVDLELQTLAANPSADRALVDIQTDATPGPEQPPSLRMHRLCCPVGLHDGRR